MKPTTPFLASLPELRAIRRDLHAHPELAYEEHRTADLIAHQLAEWGIESHRGLGKTGVLGIVRAGNGSRAIGLRADMDALSMQEVNSFGHRSRHPGKMHGCGHDGHVAMLLCAAQYLARERNFHGTVYLIFQPAEEGGGGACAMMQDGLFERFPMDAVFALHNWPGLPAGQFAISPGPVMASSSPFQVTVQGKGCHAAMPHLGVDPVPVACQLVQAFQTIVSRNLKPIDSAVISVTMMNAGQATNVIADTCTLRGSVRAFRPEVLDLVESRMQALSTELGRAFGATVEFALTRNYPPTVNSEVESALARRVATELFGTEQVVEQEPTMGSEDFAFMLLAKPGCYAFIGNGGGEHRAVGHGEGPCTLHNPSYDFNDEIIPVGASFWASLVQRYLAAVP